MTSIVNYESAYNTAVKFTSSHYENFPVISLFIPPTLRKHIAVIYQFARQADDIADEGNFTAAERLEKLEKYEQELTNSLNGKFSNYFWAALKNTVDSFNLNPQNLYYLLTAFKMDCTKKRFQDYSELLDYCRYSASPIGRIVLELYGIQNENALIFSDSICTALQLTNFYQDIKRDYAKGRIYLPLDEMKKFNVNEEIFELRKININFRLLMEYQINRTYNLFKTGKGILSYLSGRLKFQIKWTILGGEKVLEKIKNMNYDVLNFRPKLNKYNYLYLMIKSLV
ncbi:squalene synthase HpnC [Melioribacteraceae bacterium 4301-Me]|uniref:squalene synthase HpnC n=1 Tax=Pyranulibacter aquaticus TaxID=3163344 RepID=UPI00359B5E67